MYNVSKGPSKLVAKTRRGIPSHLERSDRFEHSCKKTEINGTNTSNILSDISKPVYLQINGKKLNSFRVQEAITPEHEEIVKFVSENWSTVQCKAKEASSLHNGHTSTTYYRKETNNQIKDFVPFDLDMWWDRSAVYSSNREYRNPLSDPDPEGKLYHKIKKIRKKQMLLCLLGNGKSVNTAPTGRFFYPVIQHTDVNIGSSGLHQSSPYGGGQLGGMDCSDLLGGSNFLGHPLLSGILGGGNKPMTDEDENRFSNVNINRHVIRPLYRSIKSFYRLF